jgi:hypothetical protein
MQWVASQGAWRVASASRRARPALAVLQTWIEWASSTRLAASSRASYLGYEDLVAVQAGPEGGDVSARDMFEGQEEVSAGGVRAPRSPTPLTRAPAPQERKAWWPRLRDYMGKDIMSLMSVPVFIMARDKALSTGRL